jgi:hypothetical protein
VTFVNIRRIQLVTFPELELDHALMRKGKILINTWRPVEWVYGEYQSNMAVDKCRVLDIYKKISHISLICIDIFAITFVTISFYIVFYSI